MSDKEILFSVSTNFFASFSLKPKEEKKDLVIPLINKINWRFPKKPEDLDKSDDHDKDNKSQTDNIQETEEPKEKSLYERAVEEIERGFVKSRKNIHEVLFLFFF